MQKLKRMSWGTLSSRCLTAICATSGGNRFITVVVTRISKMASMCIPPMESRFGRLEMIILLLVMLLIGGVAIYADVVL
jgi:hypothetical protein